MESCGLSLRIDFLEHVIVSDSFGSVFAVKRKPAAAHDDAAVH